MSRASSTKWYTAYPCDDPPLMRIVCFPHAGGNASGYHSWAGGLPGWCQVCAIQLPGRASRFTEASTTNFVELVPLLARAVGTLLDIPVAFFGHSLGAILAFEVSRELRRTRSVMPQRLIVAGRRAPHLADTDAPRHDCDDADLVAYLCENEGTPAEFLANKELLKVVLPVLRADLKLLKSHQFTEEEPLSCPILVYGGTADDESACGRLRAWRCHTTARFTLEMLPGGHFFVHSEKRRLVCSISGELQRAVVDRAAPALSTNPPDVAGVTALPVVSPSCGSNET